MSGRHEIESRREQIEALCREHQVARLLVFGSVLRDDFDPQSSDIDLLVEFLPGVNKGWMAEYTELKDAMERLFGRKVDVISERALKNPYVVATVDREKELLMPHDPRAFFLDVEQAALEILSSQRDYLWRTI